MNYFGLWTSRFPTIEAKSKGLEQWAKQLGEYSPEVINHAVGLCVKSLNDAPTVAKFREQAELAKLDLRPKRLGLSSNDPKAEAEQRHREWLASEQWGDVWLRKAIELGGAEQARQWMKDRKLYPFN